jgi:hypothetical protein
MAMEYVEVGQACDDCVIAIANDDYTGMSDERAAEVRAGLKRIGEFLTVGEDEGFRWYGCRVCGSSLAGNRHRVGYLTPLRVSVRRIRLNGGGYDRTGRYWGGGAPLFHVASDYDSVNYETRAADRVDVIAEVSRRYPGVKFTRR